MANSNHPALGLDIGGANLKAAMANGFACEVAFPLWRKPDELAAAISQLIANAPPHASLAVTMTGELADCYATKAEGVEAIVAAVEAATGDKPAQYYAMGRPFVDAGQAVANWRLVAAANWHALATVLAARLASPGMLVDVGSTTSDIIPFTAAGPPNPLDDTARLLAGQLLYQGVGRTPLCAIVDELPYRGGMCPVAAELFATTADASLLVGRRPPDGMTEAADSADGRPMTEPFATARLGRMLCADASQFDREDAIAIADYVTERMTVKLATSIERTIATAREVPQKLVVSGSGSWLAKEAISRLRFAASVTELADEIGQPASACAPAWAMAELVEQRGES